MYEKKDGSTNWIFNFRRRLFNWKYREVSRLTDFLLAAPSINPNQTDMLSWVATNSGVFSVSPVYKFIEHYFGITLSTTSLFGSSMSLPKYNFSVGYHGKIKSRPLSFFIELVFYLVMHQHFVFFVRRRMNL